MSDRKMIKWQPFDSVMHTKKIVNELSYKKEKIETPILSADQYEEIEFNIKYAIDNNIMVEIKYFNNGNILIFTGNIKKIDKIKTKIIFSNYFSLYFSQIIFVKLVHYN